MGIQADTLEGTFKAMQEKLAGIVPEIELRYKAELAFEINQLKKERGAIILGHNYMEPALFHSVPDVVGDSLELSRKAAETDADPIVFCGVKFMAETAKILNPDKTVLLPAKRAGCSLAESITAEDVRELKARFPGVPVVTYINTYAEVKAETDVCCTSGNAARVVNSFEDEAIIFLPDEYLAANVAQETGKQIIFPTRGVVKDPKPGIDYQMVGWHGRCEVHEKFTVEDHASADAGGHRQRTEVGVPLGSAEPSLGECQRLGVKVAEYRPGESVIKSLAEREVTPGGNIERRHRLDITFDRTS